MGDKMSRIVWDESFSIDVEEIDSQHKIWIQTINDLHDALSRSSSGNLSEETEKAVKIMWDYTRFHFETEEAYMKRIKYPDLLIHQALHDKFSLEVMEIYNEIKEGKQVLSTVVMKMLLKWLQEHILQDDKKIGLYLSGQHSS